MEGQTDTKRREREGEGERRKRERERGRDRERVCVYVWEGLGGTGKDRQRRQRAVWEGTRGGTGKQRARHACLLSGQGSRLEAMAVAGRLSPGQVTASPGVAAIASRGPKHTIRPYPSTSITRAAEADARCTISFLYFTLSVPLFHSSLSM